MLAERFGWRPAAGADNRIFGMNVDFPGFGTTDARCAVVCGMIVTLVALLGFFPYERWI